MFSELNTFTDDTVLTIAIADAILHGKSYDSNLIYYGNKYPDAGYGGTFIQWLSGVIIGPYNSFGNGAAMRVSPVGFAFHSREEVLQEAKKTAEMTHNHPEGIKGAQAVALAVYLAKKHVGKDQIKAEIESEFGYDLNRTIEQIRPDYSFEVSCQKSVPESIIAFLESSDFKSAIRNAISLGGDSDTMACIAGAIAQAYYEVIPKWITDEVYARIPEEFKKTIILFEEKYF